MPSRSLVLDANILIRSVLGVRVTHLVATFGGFVSLVSTQVAYDDAERYLPMIAAKRDMANPEKSLETLEELKSVVLPLHQDIYFHRREEAIARIARRDPEDWPILAAALSLDCPIWTENQDFFGTGVATWTTDRVELYLRNACPHIAESTEGVGC